MKASTVAAALAPTAVSGQWYHGAPQCAQSCLSSAYASITTTTGAVWPQQSDYCDDNRSKTVSSCLKSACTSTSSAFSSYSSLSSSLCSKWQSCSHAGSTGVQTITYGAGPVTWGAPGGWGGNGNKGAKDSKFGGANGGNGNGNGGGFNGGNWPGVANGNQTSLWSEWSSAWSGSKTWSGGVMTVTGCADSGSPWYVGPNCGWNDKGGFNGWVGWGSGWSWASTSTGTYTWTTTDSAGSTTTTSGLATVAAAVSGSETTTTVVGATSTASPSSSSSSAAVASGPGPEGSVVTGMMGVALGAVVALAGML